MSPNQRRAHAAMLSVLPIRTISTPETRTENTKQRDIGEIMSLHEKILALKAQGKSNIEIHLDLGISTASVSRYSSGKVLAIARGRRCRIAKGT